MCVLWQQYQLLVFRPCEHSEVPQLVHRQQAEWALHSGGVGGERRFEAGYKESDWGRRIVSREEGLGIHSLDSECTRSHAWKEDHAQRSQARKHFHWLIGEFKSWWSRSESLAELLDFWGVFQSRDTTLHESRSPLRKRLWLEVRCMVNGLHSLWNMYASFPF